MNATTQRHPNPFYIFFWVLPTGISNGFATVVLPFLLTKNGFPVALTASIVAIGFSANVWRFLWGPVVDISLSLRKWYWIGVLAAAASMLLLSFTPFTGKGAVLLSVIVFLSQAACTLILLPVNGFIVKRVEENKRGRASGWYQAGNLAGTGLGGGGGLWLANQYGVQITGLLICVASVVVALSINLIQDEPSHKEETILHNIKAMGKDILAMLKIPVAVFVIVLLLQPIGTGAMLNLWSAISLDWKTDTETVVLVTGLLGGLVSAIGCIVGGVIVDKWGIWAGYLGCGAICALATFIMGISPLLPAVYIGGVLTYGFCVGLINAAFTSVIFYAVGKKHVATKASLLASLGNMPPAYMTAVNGWTHDRYDSQFMLVAEGIVGILFVLLFYFILKLMKAKQLIPVSVD